MSPDRRRSSFTSGIPTAFARQSLQGLGLLRSEGGASQIRSALGASRQQEEVSMEQMESERDEIEYLPKRSARIVDRSPTSVGTERSNLTANVNAKTLERGKHLQAKLQLQNREKKADKDRSERAGRKIGAASPYTAGWSTYKEDSTTSSVPSGRADIPHGHTSNSSHIGNGRFTHDPPQAGPSRAPIRNTRSSQNGAYQALFTASELAQSRGPLTGRLSPSGLQQGMPSSSLFAADPVRKLSIPGAYPEDDVPRHTPSQANFRSRASRSAGQSAPLQYDADVLVESPPPFFALPSRPSVPPPDHDRNRRRQVDHRQRRRADVGSSDIPAHSPRSTSAYSQSPEKTAPFPDQTWEDDDYVLQQTPTHDARSAARVSGSAGRKSAFGSHAKKASTTQEPDGRRMNYNHSSPTKPSTKLQPTTYSHRRQRRHELDEEILSPDGPWTDKGSARPGVFDDTAREVLIVDSDNDDEIQARPLTSREKARAADEQSSSKKPLRRPMKDKNGKPANDPRFGHERRISDYNNKAIRSSQLNLRRFGPVDIEYARYGNAATALNAKTFSFSSTGIEVGGPGARVPTIVRLPIETITNALVCPLPDHACLHIHVDTDLALGHERGPIRDGLRKLSPAQFDFRNIVDPDFVIVFKTEGDTAEMLQRLCSELKDRQVKLAMLDIPGSKALREALPPVAEEKRDTRVMARQRASEMAASAAESRTRTNKKNRDSDASSVDAAQGRKTSKAISVDPNQSKLNFTPQEHNSRDAPSNGDRQAALRRSNRARVSREYHDVGDSDEEMEPKLEAERLLPALSSIEKQELLFPYPLTGRAELHITGGDRYRVKSGDFLNDTLLEFGLRHRIAGLPVATQEKIHLFNSFFYDKLSSRAGRYDQATQNWPAYNSVRKWTKGKSVFDMDYIVVPINEAYHWYLAIIVNPKGILKERAASPSVEPPATRARTSIGRDALNGSHQAASSIRSTSRPADTAESDSDINELQADDGEADELSGGYGEADQQITRPETSEVQSGRSSLLPAHLADADGNTSTGIDPLALGGAGRNPDVAAASTENDESDGVTAVQGGCERMQIEDVEDTDDESQGAPISTETTQAHSASFQRAVQSSDLPPADDDEISHVSAPPEPSKPKLQILGSGACWIITCDSLGGQHKAVKTVLERWLQFEARDKLQKTHRLSDAMYVEAKVPQQNNFSDCGLWLIHYVSTLLQHQSEVIGFIERPVPYAKEKLAREKFDADMHKVWRFPETLEMRPHWEGIINSLRDEYRKLRPAAAGESDQAHADNEASHEDVQWLSQTGGGKPDLAADQASHLPNSSDIGGAGVDDADIGQPPSVGQTETEEEEVVEEQQHISARMSDRTEEEEPVEEEAVGDEEALRTEADAERPASAQAIQDDMSNIDPDLEALELESHPDIAIIPDSLGSDLAGANAQIFSVEVDQVDPRLLNGAQAGDDFGMDGQSSTSAPSTLETDDTSHATPAAARQLAAGRDGVTEFVAGTELEDERPSENDNVESESPFNSLRPEREPLRRGKERPAPAPAARTASVEDVFEATSRPVATGPGTTGDTGTLAEVDMDGDSEQLMNRLSKPHQSLKLGSGIPSSPSAPSRERTAIAQHLEKASAGTDTDAQTRVNKPISSASSKLTELSERDELESVNSEKPIGVEVKSYTSAHNQPSRIAAGSPSEPRPAAKRSAASSPVPVAARKKQKNGQAESSSNHQGKTAADPIDISSDGEGSTSLESKAKKPKNSTGASRKRK